MLVLIPKNIRKWL